MPFTLTDQERGDTGTGMNFNYLKQIIDQITSRLGTVSFTPLLQSEEQSYDFIVYKNDVERILRKFIKDSKFNRMSLEAFHNAAILCYSHAFIDPFTGKLTKASDYEVGMFESQFNRDNIVQMLFRDYMFPVASVNKYLVDCDDAQKKAVWESVSGKNSVDFKMYFNCIEHKVYVTINNMTLPPHDYPFDKVLMVTYSWDTGFAKTHATSEFDLLYPLQREINKIAAKVQQLIRMYKGPVPVFNSDIDLEVREISNGGGEALYVDSSRPVDSMVTVINPMPLDPQLEAEIVSYKSAMYELAGIQNASFNMDNMRSAAAVIALDQTRDSVFQAQLSGLADFIKNAINLYIKFFAQYPEMSTDTTVDWPAISTLLDNSYVDMQPVHLNNPLSDEDEVTDSFIDYVTMATDRIILDIIKGKKTFYDVPMYIEMDQLVYAMALTLIKFDALGVTVPDTVYSFMISAYVEKVKNGEVQL